ncbi:MAG: PAS domain-containing protein [Actinomycetota bacterium]|jgi:PAS domain-containing protein|nr:PAS domain-containing protein [Euzebyaceae bacterium]MDQ3451836.1 PAS domain-containing protein [Actinomycetota bacterium]
MAVVVVDRHWIVTHASPRFTELLGWPPEVISGRSLADLVHPDDQSGWEAALGDLDLLGFAALDCRVHSSSGGWLRLAATMTSHQQLITVLCEIRLRD